MHTHPYLHMSALSRPSVLQFSNTYQDAKLATHKEANRKRRSGETSSCNDLQVTLERHFVSIKWNRIKVFKKGK